MAWSGRRQVPDSGRPGRARGERHGRGRGRWQWPGGHSRVLGSAAGLPGLSPAVPQAVRGTLPRPTLIPGSAAASSRAQVFAGERTELRLRSGAATRMKATDRKSGGEGKSVSGSVDLGGRRILKKKKHKTTKK